MTFYLSWALEIEPHNGVLSFGLRCDSMMDSHLGLYFLGQPPCPNDQPPTNIDIEQEYRA